MKEDKVAFVKKEDGRVSVEPDPQAKGVYAFGDREPQWVVEAGGDEFTRHTALSAAHTLEDEANMMLAEWLANESAAARYIGVNRPPERSEHVAVTFRGKAVVSFFIHRAEGVENEPRAELQLIDHTSHRRLGTPKGEPVITWYLNVYTLVEHAYQVAKWCETNARAFTEPKEGSNDEK